MTRISIALAALALTVGIVAAQECGDKPCEGKKEHCDSCKSTAFSSASEKLAAARKALADAPKAEEALSPEDREALVKAREFLVKETAGGRSISVTYEATAKLLLAAAAQEGSTDEQRALLKKMGSTYCAMAKAFGGCGESCCAEFCGDCAGECKSECGGAAKEGAMGCPATSEKAKPDAAALAKKAKEAHGAALKLLEAAKVEMTSATPEQMEKMQAAMKVAQDFCPICKAAGEAMGALAAGFAALGTMNVPDVSGGGHAVRDELVKGAFELHGAMASCGSCEEECPEEPAEELDEAIETPGTGGSS